MFPATRFRLRVLDECGSTQEVLLAERGSPDFHGSALLAYRQTAGFGRRGRSWDTGVGNLALSLGLKFSDDRALPLVSFACGLALYNVTLRLLPSEADLRLKWPNDLYLNGRKLAGLLAQARQVPGTGPEVVVGIGMNLAHAPEGLAMPAVSLSEYTQPPAPDAFARDFLAELESVFDENRDFASLKQEWETAARLGEGKLYVVGEQGSVRGEELLPTGELLVRDESGRERKLASEEVSVRLLLASTAPPIHPK